jgi:hypothetical protein
MNGTSVAAAAIAGSLALVAQYIEEGWHNISDLTTATPALLRAFIVQSTSVARPDQRSGWGVPDLSRTLVFEGHSGARGLRFFAGAIVQGNESNFSVRLTHQDDPLTITLSWIDPAVASSDATMGLLCDLDLFVTTPSGGVLYGNMNYDQEDSLSTTEKVILAPPHVGEYVLHVRANPSFLSVPVSFALVVNGPFNHTDFVANPADMRHRRFVAEPRRCDNSRTGTFCQTEVVTVRKGETVATTIRPREYKHFYLPLGADFEGRLTIWSDMPAHDAGMVRYVINGNRTWKLSTRGPYSPVQPIAGVQFMAQEILVDFDFVVPSELWFSVFSDFYHNITYRMRWGEVVWVWNWQIIAVPTLIILALLSGMCCAIVWWVQKRQQQVPQEPSADEEAERNHELLEDVDFVAV